jgi:hypothetical protein
LEQKTKKTKIKIAKYSYSPHFSYTVGDALNQTMLNKKIGGTFMSNSRSPSCVTRVSLQEGCGS